VTRRQVCNEATDNLRAGIHYDIFFPPFDVDVKSLKISRNSEQMENNDLSNVLSHFGFSALN
jgi:hypothetical protein